MVRHERSTEKRLAKKKTQVKNGYLKKSMADRFTHGIKAAPSDEKTATNQNREKA